MAKASLEINSENILPIIKKWLYSDKDIFLRELVSNSCDAIGKLKQLRDLGKVNFEDAELRIDIETNKDAKTLTISDTGIGMTEEEVKKYIAQLAFSGAEEFVEKYKSSKESDQIIGHFGLGFYSAFMVSKTVDLHTQSYTQNSSGALWSCDGSSQYTLVAKEKDKRGTEVVLHISPEEEEYLEEAKLTSILNKHCLFLPYPIYLNGKRINEKAPLWIKPASEATKEEYLDLYRTLYPGEPAPLFWIHLNIDYPFNLKGILYFPKLSKNFDFKSNLLQLFCNRVFVSDNCKDLLPEYLTALRGVIDSPDIPLNVSRSTLQLDKTVRQLGSHISKKVSDKLASLYKTEKETFLKHWPDIELIIKLGALQDDKFFTKVQSFLVWQNTQKEWVTLQDYLERNKEKHENKIFYTTIAASHMSPALLELYKNIEVLEMTSPIDTHCIAFLEGKLNPAKFQRIDGGIDEAILDKGKEKGLLDASGKSESAHIADFVRGKLDKNTVEVEAKSLASDALPAFVVIDEQSRRMRDYLSMTAEGELPAEMQGKHTFVVNTNSPLIQSLRTLNKTTPELATAMLKHLYDLSLLSQRELSAQKLTEFVTRSTEVLSDMAQIAAKPAK